MLHSPGIDSACPLDDNLSAFVLTRGQEFVLDVIKGLLLVAPALVVCEPVFVVVAYALRCDPFAENIVFVHEQRDGHIFEKTGIDEYLEEVQCLLQLIEVIVYC